MSLEANKAIVRKLVEAANARNLGLMDELMAADFVDPKRQLQGLEAHKQFAATIYKGFFDFRETIEGIIAEGDKVWVRIESTGTHTGESWITPYGQEVYRNIRWHLSYSQWQACRRMERF